MAVEHDLEELPGAFMDAWNRHDMAALAALFADDANFVNVVGAWWKSRTEIEEAHAATHATLFRDSRLEGDIAAITQLAPGVAALHVLWTLTGMAAPDGSPAGPRQGVMLFVAGQAPEGGWYIQIAQNTDIVEGAIVPQQAA